MTTTPHNARMQATLVVYRSRSLRRSQRYGWRLVAANGRIIAASGEGYSDLDECQIRGMDVANGWYADPKVVMP
mgnify:FL=1